MYKFQIKCDFKFQCINLEFFNSSFLCKQINNAQPKKMYVVLVVEG